jgi:hypothetical protein
MKTLRKVTGLLICLMILQSCASQRIRCRGIKAHPDYYINGAANW